MSMNAKYASQQNYCIHLSLKGDFECKLNTTMQGPHPTTKEIPDSKLQICIEKMLHCAEEMRFDKIRCAQLRWETLPNAVSYQAPSQPAKQRHAVVRLEWNEIVGCPTPARRSPIAIYALTLLLSTECARQCLQSRASLALLPSEKEARSQTGRDAATSLRMLQGRGK